KPVPQFFKLRPELEMIVNFPVEDNSALAAIFKNGLIPRFQIDDFQASRAKGKQIRGKNALLIRPPVDESRHHLLNSFFLRLCVLSCKSSYPTQCKTPFQQQRYSYLQASRFRCVKTPSCCTRRGIHAV